MLSLYWRRSNEHVQLRGTAALVDVFCSHELLILPPIKNARILYLWAKRKRSVFCEGQLNMDREPPSGQRESPACQGSASSTDLCWGVWVGMGGRDGGGDLSSGPDKSIRLIRWVNKQRLSLSLQSPYFWPSNCWEPENTDYGE